MSSIQTEFSVPTSSSAAANQPIRRQPRGHINRRACQKCRQLKIRCDGDAENNVGCSNCDYGTCVYDKSPRKNRQVERLNTKVENLEKTLVETQENVETIKNEIEILKLEKQILNLLFECNAFFTDHPIIFNELRQAINESRCWLILLELIHTLLLRLSQSDGNDANAIIEMLKPLVKSAMSFCGPNEAFNPNQQALLNIEEMNIMNNRQLLNTIPGGSTSMITGMANLNLHSPGSEAGSDISLIPDVKLVLSSPLLPPTSNIDINSPPTEDVGSYFSGPYLNEFSPFSFEVFESYGSNSSSNGQ